MSEFLAHLVLMGRFLTGRGRRTVVIGGVHWSYCAHRSHRCGLPCWRWFLYDGYCAHHNRTCYTRCPTEEA